jgi:xylan 1,4-beta-xylosidase
MEITFAGANKSAVVSLYRVDSTHGNVVPAFDAMGRPPTPSREQISALQKAGEASPPEHLHLTNGALTVTIPAQGLVLLKLDHAGR